MNRKSLCMIYLALCNILLSSCGQIITPEPSPTPTESPLLVMEPFPSPFPPSSSASGESPAGVAHLGTSWSDFSLSFDPTQWDIISFQQDWPGLDALAHRSLIRCRIIPNIPVGLGDEWTFEEGSIDLGGHQFHLKRFFRSGELKFVIYFGFFNQPYEGAVEVHFTTDQKACLQAAEALFSATEIILPIQPTAPAPVIHKLPGPAYETPFQIPVGPGGIRYRGLPIPNALVVLQHRETMDSLCLNFNPHIEPLNLSSIEPWVGRGEIHT